MGELQVDLVAIVDDLYRIDLPRDEWLVRTTESVRPLLDRHRLGIIGNFYECVDPCAYIPGRSVVRDVPVALGAVFFNYVMEPHPPYIADSILSRRCYFCSRTPSGSVLGPVLDRMREHGASDRLTLNTVEPDGSGCCFGSFQADDSPLSARASVALTRVAGHLGAAYRLRHRFANAGVSATAASAVMETDGKVRHAVGAAASPGQRECLSAAVRAMDQARSRRGRRDSLKAIMEWKALVGNRWLLLDCVECDGRRFVLAVDSEPAVNPIDLLSPREREVVRRLLSGQTTAAMASELSLAVATVRVLIGRAATKLRARSRADLLKKAAPLLSHTGAASARAMS